MTILDFSALNFRSVMLILDLLFFLNIPLCYYARSIFLFSLVFRNLAWKYASWQPWIKQHNYNWQEGCWFWFKMSNCYRILTVYQVNELKYDGTL